MISILYNAGLRVAELVALEPADLHEADRYVIVKSGKGGKRREATMVSGWDAVAAWSKYREAQGHGKRGPLFCTSDGKPVSTNTVRVMLHRLAARAGLDHLHISPHAFRHSHAAALDQAGVPLRAIAGELGHSRPTVTDRYLQGLTPRERRETVIARTAPTAPPTPPTTAAPDIAAIAAAAVAEAFHKLALAKLSPAKRAAILRGEYDTAPMPDEFVEVMNAVMQDRRAVTPADGRRAVAVAERRAQERASRRPVKSSREDQEHKQTQARPLVKAANNKRKSKR